MAFKLNAIPIEVANLSLAGVNPARACSTKGRAYEDVFSGSANDDIIVYGYDVLYRLEARVRPISLADKILLRMAMEKKANKNSNVIAHFKMMKKILMGETGAYCNGRMCS